jgi:3-phosphoshikimate 1-carboxyvinyltransferase
MRVISLSHPSKHLKGSVQLPSSKSISNRALILNHVLKGSLALENLSTADDTVLMQKALQQHNGSIHLKNAGTCMRFLTAYYAALEKSDITLLCDERMEKRPILELVDILIQLGAEITYLNRYGFPPLHIKGKKLEGRRVVVSARASSQFTSALMMIAPLCTNGLEIALDGEITSKPYIEMTAQLMRRFGIEVQTAYPLISIPGSLQTVPVTAAIHIEADWSAASYWYSIVALSKDAAIHLPGLSIASMQGDAAIAEYMRLFHVETIPVSDGILLRKTKKTELSTVSDSIHLNLADQPDLAPSLAVVAAATNTSLHLTGLQNLVIKESNRLLALKTELSKLGAHITSSADSLLIEKNETGLQYSASPVQTYNDHRMAMAFAPLALSLESIAIIHPEVVEKSYPHFWDDLTQQGFIITDTSDIQ